MTTVTMRKIVKIDEDKCNGCGLCAPKCAEGAITIVDGKARLAAENLCDGLGACLGECPQDAITIEERPADAFDEQAVERQKQSTDFTDYTDSEKNGERPRQESPLPAPHAHHHGGCPGSMLRMLKAAPATAPAAGAMPAQASRLGHWPVQLALVPVKGPIWEQADVLIAADCVAFAMPDFHERMLAGKTLAVACPKLDDVARHVDKLAAIFAGNDIRSITVAHMEVPCCTGIVQAVRAALHKAGRTDIPVRDITVGIDGVVQE